MISISKMVSGKATVSRRLTYQDDGEVPKGLVRLKREMKPIVVWNVTKACNLKCVHCYASAGRGEGELSYEECVRIIDELSKFGVPLILFSGGEPLMREDIIDVMGYAKGLGIKCVLSTNGTLITKDLAEQLSEVVDYVGVSLDGVGDVNDRFRGVKGAFDKALKGLINARDAGIQTGIRFTVTRFNVGEVEKVLKLAVEHDIPRFCMYHLVPSGRADFSYDISNEERRRIVDFLFEFSNDCDLEILTVDNPCDGVYVCLKLLEVDEDLAYKAYEFLKYRGGDETGRTLINIDMYGLVHPNQFWWDYTCGDLKRESFEEIWLGDELLNKLREKVRYLRGKCGECAYKQVCGGFRLRALRAGDLWGVDPDCYLAWEEISANVFEKC